MTMAKAASGWADAGNQATPTSSFEPAACTFSLERCSIQINTIMTVIALRQYLNTDGSRTHLTKHYGAWDGWYLSWLHLNFPRNLGHNL